MRKHYTRDILIFGSLLIFCALFARGQQIGPFSISTSTGCTRPIDVSVKATLAMQVTGTWTGTLQPQLAVDGQPAANAQVTPAASSSKQATITANGAYIASVSGASVFLVCANTLSSGTATIFVNVSPFTH
jgi:hypothetical protein